MADEPKKMTRNEFMTACARGSLALALGGAIGWMGARNVRGGTVFQIDPNKCIQCEQCATHCVLDQSAVRCFHEFKMCGYCDLCTGFFEPQPNALNEGAENQICPANAIKRSFIEDPYFEYEIDEEACIGCSRCVDTCNKFGNSSLYLQIRHDVCVHCNMCAIAAHCPADAFVEVPADNPYLNRMGDS